MAVAAILDDSAARDVFHALAFVRDSSGRWQGCRINNRLVGIHLSHSGESLDAIGVDGGDCDSSEILQVGN